jgi:hypothetical protein
MKKNMGSADRMIRIIIAVIIGILYYTGVVSGTVAIVLMVIGGIFLLTGFINFCPLYVPFGITTLKSKKDK